MVPFCMPARDTFLSLRRRLHFYQDVWRAPAPAHYCFPLPVWLMLGLALYCNSWSCPHWGIHFTFVYTSNDIVYLLLNPNIHREMHCYWSLKGSHISWAQVANVPLFCTPISPSLLPSLHPLMTTGLHASQCAFHAQILLFCDEVADPVQCFSYFSFLNIATWVSP